MARTKINNKVRWIKQGKGKLYLADGRVIQGGETFLAFLCEIPSAFRDSVTLLDEIPEVKPVKVSFTLTKVDDDLYNVTDANGKVMNESPLSKDEALDVITNLEN